MLHEKDLDSVSDTGFLEEKVQVLPIKPTTFWLLVQGPLVWKVDNSIHWLNLYPVDSAIGFPNSYPLDSDLSGG